MILSSILILFSALFLAQETSESQSDIVKELMTNGESAELSKLSGAKKALAIKRLEAAQPQATGKRGQQIAFLLAALGSNYARNRDYLIRAFQSCNHHAAECDEDTGGFLIGLYKAGHPELLSPLLAGAATSDGALAEMLAEFYSDVLVEEPAQFVEAIQRFPPAAQKSACDLAVSDMSPEIMEKARNGLRAIKGTVALQCLHRIEKAEARNSR